MASEDLGPNGHNVPSPPGDDLFVHGCAQRDHELFDARVHSSPATESDATVTILLRRSGRFLKALFEPGSADVVSLDTARRLNPESLVRVLGSFVTGDKCDKGDIASEVATFRVANMVALSTAKADLPGSLKLHGAPSEALPPVESRAALIDERLDNRLLDGRVVATAAIFKIFSGVHELAVEYLAARGFSYIPTPAFIGYRFPEEDDDYFSLSYFDRTARLAPTGEIYLGMALSADLERVYDIHTVFRREPASDGRHLTEFTMLELVFNLQNDWTEILELADSLLVSLIRSLQEREKYNALTQFAKRLYPSAGTFKLGLNENGKLIRVKFSEAKAILRESLGCQSNDQDDLTSEEEAALGRFLSNNKSHLGPPTDVFIITHFPRHLRPCNVYPSDEGGNTTQSFDIILRGQEVVTGCRLLHSHEELRSAFAARAHPIDPDSPEWRPYMAAHEIGMPPWGGFGLGINRLVQGFLGLTDIRETVLFPRDAARLTP
ncbi:class II aaRS and biotin synthetase [Periconia macrospinosa]|uniref:aspartate--tRNA ligase n=1 Tax=Periconia macrospinosa TaxID=97972 RepID=A0A2V1DWI4_9PLEO|nr:class II aaRS and biotin synthetase [Periconia macrospinosa]